jgi:hypothetical protein
MDEQPLERVLPAVRAANVHAALSRVMRWMETGGQSKPRDADWEAWNWVQSQLE